MEVKHKFFKCDLCGNLAVPVIFSGAVPVCCGQTMTELIPNTVEASAEKHIPSVTSSVNGIEVKVGSVPHPMEEGHHIGFVYVQTEQGGQRKGLQVGAEPKCAFSFTDDKPIAVFAYCNLHGIWKAEL